MSLHINLLGTEEKSHIIAVLAAIHAYANGYTSTAPAPAAAPIDKAPTAAAEDTSAAEAAAEASATAAATSKKAAAAAKKAADKKAADEAAAVAAELEAEQAAGGEPELDYTVEELRAVAGKLNNDETRPLAVAILSGIGVKSISALATLTAAQRVDVFDKLTAAVKEVEAAALN